MVQEQQADTKVSKQMRALAIANPASRLANRTSAGASLLRPSRSVRSAVERLLLSTLDPAAACGQRPIRINVDQIQLPKFPIQFDNNFIVRSIDGYKIMLVASPIISAVIFTKSQNVDIYPNRVIKTPINDGYIHYVINSKLDFLAKLDDRQILTTKDDYRRYRMITASMQAQWAGPELFKNGIAVTARITDKENLATFNPNSKADNVISNISDVLVSTCQHSEPVFDFKPVDANNDDGGGNLPDKDKSAYATYIYEAKGGFESDPTSPDGFVFPITSFGWPITNIQTIIRTWLTQVAAKLASPEAKSTSATIISALTNKYKNFKTILTNSGGSNSSYSCTIKASVTMNDVLGTSIRQKFVSTANFSNVTDTSDDLFFSKLVEKLITYIVDPTSVDAYLPLDRPGKLVIELGIPIDGDIDQRALIPIPIAPILDNGEIVDTPFYDDAFLQPVTDVQPSGEFQSTLQYQTQHMFEMVLGDTTVLATAAVANSPTDSQSTVSKSMFDRYQKLMKGMPPAHIMNDVGMTRTTMAQFASRGILNDIFKLAGPIASALFPSAAPVVNALKPVVDVVDGYF